MYLWNYKALIKDFKEDKVSEKDKFSYFLFSMILLMVSTTGLLMFYQTTGITNAEIINSWVYLAFFIIATVIIYKKNKEGDNKHFIERYICLSVPIFIKVFVLSVPFLLIATSLYYGLTAATLDPAVTAPWEYVVGQLISIIPYYILYTSVSEITQAKK